jgi:SAM-dependent methyltransferase
MADDSTGGERITATQLAGQLAYYTARAPEYDDWWYRRGPFDRGPADNEVWFRDGRTALAALEALDLGDKALELAPGTGLWTVHLAPRVRSLTLVDGSPAMLAHNPAAPAAHVRVHIADLFTWDTDERYDAVVFTFWISHVPRERLDGFFAGLGRWLRPGGVLFFIDNLRTGRPDPHVEREPGAEAAGQTTVRRLYDGSEATVVKNYYDAGTLRRSAAAAGIDLDIHTTSRYFQYGTGRRR